MKIYKIVLKKSVEKQLYKLPKKDVEKIINTIDKLKINPRPYTVIKLKNTDKFRIRVGNYRIIYSIFDNKLIIEIIKIAHRKNVYNF